MFCTWIHRSIHHRSRFLYSKTAHIQGGGRENKDIPHGVQNVFVLIPEKETLVDFWQEEARTQPVSPGFPPALHSSFIFPRSSAYIPCAV